MIEIPLTLGKVALIDDADLPLVQDRKWHAFRDRGRWYARASSSHRGPKVRMHRLILPGVPLVDHKNGDGLDNQRHNLRPATEGENHVNRPKSRGVSRFKGVWWSSRTRRWGACFSINDRTRHLGQFASEEDAARAYNAAVLAQWGEFAWLNVLPPKEAQADGE